MEDEKIIELFFNRSESAIQELDCKYGKLCSHVSCNILSNIQDAKECVNDAFLSVWNEIPPTVPNNLKAFVCKIARRISINKLKYITRKKRCGAMNLLLSELDECIPSANDVSKEFERKQTVELINRWLKDLDDETQLLFVRRYAMMDSITTLSKIFSMTESNVSTKLYRARKSLKNCLEKEGISV